MSERTLAEQLLVELTAQRLITRAIVGAMIANSRKPISTVIAALEEAMEKTSPEMIPLPDVDPVVQAEASRLARRRAIAMLEDLGALVAPLRARKVGRAA